MIKMIDVRLIDSIFDQERGGGASRKPANVVL
jgi:hypothetical protein